MSGAPGAGGPARETPFAGYVLLQRIAVGGTSEVFLARPKEGNSPAPRVAIKRLLPDLAFDKNTRRTFATEAKVHSAAKHRNVVEIYESGDYEGEPYIAMEYVSGVDLFRLLRFAEPPVSSRTSGDRIARAGATRTLGVTLAVYIARELCDALSCVHRVTDETGEPLGVVHRDVTPSNIYLSDRGEVKLGDFGIARVTARRPQPSVALKGKYAYLAPEQVSAEPFDHRADLFSLVVVLAEMILGTPLFEGAGQLAVLLAIRDVRIDTLRNVQAALPSGLFEVLERALSRFPEDRYASATELSNALEPFENGVSRDSLRRELATWVKSARDASGLGRQLDKALAHGVLRDSMPDSVPKERDRGSDAEPDSQRPTLEPGEVIHCAIRRKGSAPKPIRFAKLVELLATGQVSADDEVDIGDGFRRAGAIPRLARYLPPSTGTTDQVEGPGVPDYTARLPISSVPEVLVWLVQNLETGLLIADSAQSRCELYFDQGKLVLAASSEASTLLGEHLIARGAINRGELDVAILVMHKYDGRLGDTLIGLGLVDPVDVFQAIRAQGRKRVAGLFCWKTGVMNFYRGVRPQKLAFSLDLDVPVILLSGLTETRPDVDVLEAWFSRRQEVLAAVSPPPLWARGITWPALFMTVLRALGTGKTVEAMLEIGTAPRKGPTPPPTRAELLRTLEAAITLGVVIGGPGPIRSGSP